MVKSQRQPYSRLLAILIVLSFVGVGVGLVISLIFLIPNQFKSQYKQHQGNTVLTRLV
jgi:uncharacterized membrane protein YgaE (UPF0421/DUF939 family)